MPNQGVLSDNMMKRETRQLAVVLRNAWCRQQFKTIQRPYFLIFPHLDTKDYKIFTEDLSGFPNLSLEGRPVQTKHSSESSKK